VGRTTPTSVNVKIPRALAGLALVTLLAWNAGAQDRPLTFGVLNQQSASLTAERWNPILQYVSTTSGIPLQLRMGPTVEDTDAMMGRGELDFVFTNHNFQSEFEGVGYKVIARWSGEPIRGVIAVTTDSPIRELRQLAGRRVAFPSRDAFAAYAVPLLALKRAGVTMQEVLAANQEGALAQLKARRVDAAAVNSRLLAQYEEREAVRFRTIFVSDGYPDLAVIAHPRIPAAVVERIRQALVGMKSDPAAAPVLALARSRGFDPATDREYDGVRKVYRAIGQ
jgi:phosphonate transport system substrate-binding protein